LSLSVGTIPTWVVEAEPAGLVRLHGTPWQPGVPCELAALAFPHSELDLHALPQPDSTFANPSHVEPLRFGPLRVNLDALLAHLNADVGIASGQGLNCLLNIVLQLHRNTRRHDHAAHDGLDREARSWREQLRSLGMVGRQGQIDLYGNAGVGMVLANNLALLIQAIQMDANGSLRAHPVLGQGHGPLVQYLYTPGHFQGRVAPGTFLGRGSVDESAGELIRRSAKIQCRHRRRRYAMLITGRSISRCVSTAPDLASLQTTFGTLAPRTPRATPRRSPSVNCALVGLHQVHHHHATRSPCPPVRPPRSALT
jgi:hypothetical protein